MNYILYTDVHGHPDRIMALLYLLQERGWRMEKDYDGHPVLVSDDEILLLLGDNNDRGAYTGRWTYLAMNSHRNQTIVSLMGNHDYRFWKHYIKGYDRPNEGFGKTMEYLHEFPAKAEIIRDTALSLPYWFVGKTFVAAHAYWNAPYPNDKEAMYGPTENNRADGYAFRIPWWLDPPLVGKPIFFGHYHMRGEGLHLGKHIYCLDNHDAGYHSVAIINDETGDMDIKNLKPIYSNLYGEFLVNT